MAKLHKILQRLPYCVKSRGAKIASRHIFIVFYPPPNGTGAFSAILNKGKENMAICEQNNLKALQEKDAPLVSVVIPVYNNELYLSDALDSLVRQTYKKLEIILVDDASPGNVEPIFEKYKSKCPEYIWKLIKKEKNGRIFHARATGSAAA